MTQPYEIEDYENKLKTKINYNYNYHRNLIIVLDLTEKMKLNDFPPSRQKVLFPKLEAFIKNYFKFNFMSSISIFIMKNYMTKLISPRLDDPNKIIQNLRDHQILKDPINTKSKDDTENGTTIQTNNTISTTKEAEIISGLPSIYNALYV